MLFVCLLLSSTMAQVIFPAQRSWYVVGVLRDAVNAHLPNVVVAGPCNSEAGALVLLHVLAEERQPRFVFFYVTQLP